MLLKAISVQIAYTVPCFLFISVRLLQRERDEPFLKCEHMDLETDKLAGGAQVLI